MFFKKGKRDFGSKKKKAKKDTSVFFKKIQRTLLSPQKTPLFLKGHFCLLVSRKLWKICIAVKQKDTSVPPKDTSSPQKYFFLNTIMS